MLLPGSTSQSLAAALATETGRELAAVEYDRFPDGELLAAVPGFDGGEAAVVAATTSSDAHVELLQLQDAALEAGADAVTTVLPYMGYARQDTAFDQGHPVSARAVARAISAGTDRVVLVNPHEPAVERFFEVPVEVVDACPLLSAALPGDLGEPLFLAPDDGAVDLARSVRDGYGRGETDFFEKTRLSGSEVELAPSDASVEGRDVVVVDDIVATGSTMSEAVGLLHGRGVGRVLTACVHPVLARDARTKLARAGVEAIYATDTVERQVSTVTAAPAIAEVL
jgi:ribose-phosphate pyrophosphokinase